MCVVGNKQWFLESGIPVDQVFELDWWEEVTLSIPGTTGANASATNELRFVCAPAQHTSGKFR